MNRLTMPNDKGMCINSGEMCCPDENCSDVCFQERMSKLWEYENAEEHGLLVRLPCKVGDTVYEVMDSRIFSKNIKQFAINSHGNWCVSNGMLLIPFSDVGKTVFLTREAAEKALAERGKQNIYQSK